MDYKILSFILLLKSHQRNSLIYKGFSFDAFLRWSGMKISRKTFGRYMSILKEKGFIRQQGEHQEIISWRKCIELLDLPFSEKRMSSISEMLHGLSFTEAVQIVHEQVVLVVLHSQKYFTDRNKKYLSNFRSGKIRSVKNASREMGISISEYVKSIEKRTEVVTGSRHLSNVLGLSHQTANKVLNRLHKKNSLKRKVVRKNYFRGQVNHGTFDVLKETLKGKIFHISKSLSPCFVVVLGSVISF